MRRNCENNRKWSSGQVLKGLNLVRESSAVVLAISRRNARRDEILMEIRMSPKSSWKPVMKAGSRQRGWMRVTLTKHRGHGAKPLSHENKEILSSFVRPSPHLCLSAAFSVFADFYLSAPFSFTYFYLFLFAPSVYIVTRAVLTLVVGYFDIRLSAGSFTSRAKFTRVKFLRSDTFYLANFPREAIFFFGEEILFERGDFLPSAILFIPCEAKFRSWDFIFSEKIRNARFFLPA